MNKQTKPRKEYTVDPATFMAWVSAQPDAKQWPYYDDCKCPLAQFLGHKIDFDLAPTWAKMAVSRAGVWDLKAVAGRDVVITKANLLRAMRRIIE